MNKTLLPLAAAAALFAAAVQAAPETTVPQPVLDAVKRLVPGLPTGPVAPAPMPGFYEVSVGPRLFYISSNGRYLLDGDVIDLKERSNLTEARRDALRVASIDALGEDSMIVYSPKQVKHTVSIFTDIDCTYCQRLHREMDQYLARGIRVRYLAYPRAGLHSASYEKAVSVWCAEDRAAALTAANEGKDLPERSCENPVARHYALGNLIGVRGTPTIVLENGSVLPGYVPAAQLAKLLDGEPATAER